MKALILEKKKSEKGSLKFSLSLSLYIYIYTHTHTHTLSQSLTDPCMIQTHALCKQQAALARLKKTTARKTKQNFQFELSQVNSLQKQTQNSLEEHIMDPEFQ